MTTAIANLPKTALLARVLALIDGTQKHYPSGSFTLINVAYTTVTLVQLLQTLADALTTLTAAEASATDALLAARAARTHVGPVVLAYTQQLRTNFGNATSALADFGVQPEKARAPRTVEQLAVAAAKARATRQARGTKSKKQKAAIKGNVTGVVVTPVTTAAATTEPSTTKS
jgi:hypothetical protein